MSDAPSFTGHKKAIMEVANEIIQQGEHIFQPEDFQLFQIAAPECPAGTFSQYAFAVQYNSHIKEVYFYYDGQLRADTAFLEGNKDGIYDMAVYQREDDDAGEFGLFEYYRYEKLEDIIFIHHCTFSLVEFPAAGNAADEFLIAVAAKMRKEATQKIDDVGYAITECKLGFSRAAQIHTAQAHLYFFLKSAKNE